MTFRNLLIAVAMTPLVLACQNADAPHNSNFEVQQAGLAIFQGGPPDPVPNDPTAYEFGLLDQSLSKSDICEYVYGRNSARTNP